jgi:hypothetical protein
MPGRTYNSLSASRGFNGQEKDKEIDPTGNTYTAEYWEYDSRIGKRWNIEPLIAKYPWLSGYAAFGDDPINATDPDGADIIYVNGHRQFKTGSASNRTAAFQKKLKDDYWNSLNKNKTNEINKYFNESVKTEHFVTGDHIVGSQASGRIEEGEKIGIQMVKSGEIKVSTTNHIVMHSQGNAEGVGIAEGIIEQAEKQGVKNVTVNLVFLSVHQPDGISNNMKQALKKRGIQFTYANEGEALIIAPMGKIPGVADANPTNKV